MLRIITILAFNLEGKASRDRAMPQPAGKNSMTRLKWGQCPKALPLTISYLNFFSSL